MARVVIPGFRKIETSGSGGTTTNYADLSNKPSINNVPLVDNLSTKELKLTDATLTEEGVPAESKAVGDKFESLKNMFCFKKAYEKTNLTIQETTNFDTEINFTDGAGKVCMIRMRDFTPQYYTIFGVLNYDGGDFPKIASSTTEYDARLYRIVHNNGESFTVGIEISGSGLSSNTPIASFEIYFLDPIVS